MLILRGRTEVMGKNTVEFCQCVVGQNVQLIHFPTKIPTQINA